MPERKNIVAQALDRLQQRRGIEDQREADLQAQRTAEEARRLSAESQTREQNRLAKLQEQRQFIARCQPIGIGKIVVALQELISDSSGPVREEVHEDHIVFRSSGGRQIGRKSESRQEEIVGVYQYNWDNYGSPARRATRTVYSPGRKQEFEDEVQITIQYVGLRGSKDGWLGEYDTSFVVTAEKYRPDKETDTFFKKGTLTPHFYNGNGVFNSNVPGEAKDRILEVAAEVAEKCNSGKPGTKEDLPLSLKGCPKCRML